MFNSTNDAEVKTQSISQIPREILAFTLGDQEYGVDIQQVQELRGYDPVTKIANVPDFVKGVIHLRGVIVPIIDLRIQFGLANPAYDDFTVVIMVNIGRRVLGIVVDRVSDVIMLQTEQIKQVPPIGRSIDAEYLLGMAVFEDRMLSLVALKRLLAGIDTDIFERQVA